MARLLPTVSACIAASLAPLLQAGDVTLHWTLVNGAASLAPLPLDAPEKLHPVGTNQLSLTRAAALISGVAFIRPDGSFVQLDGQFGLIDLGLGRPGFTVRGVPPGRYFGLQFYIGVAPDANHADPAQWPAGHALNPLVNGLHWNWQGGYVFLALEGRYRQPDGRLGGWVYHLATHARRTRIALHHPLEIGETPAELRLAFDLSAVLDGLTLSPEGGADGTHSAPGDLIAHRLSRNLPGAFRIIRFDPASAPTAAGAPVSSPHTSGATPLPFTFPPTFPQIALPADNPLTVEGVALGKKLFHDPRLSGDGTQSCATCHDPRLAFSDDKALSLGIDGLPGTRNAMPLFNLAWSPNYAWDGSQPTIRAQSLAAMRNPVEMHADPEKVAALLAADETMRAAFTAAFPPAETAPGAVHSDTPVTATRMGLALEQFLLTLISGDSTFDRSIRGTAELTPQEQAGFKLFMTEHDPARGLRGADCFHCHGGSLFTDYQMKHNGLDLDSADPGRATVTRARADHGKFKTPSLRNVAVTAPYMHDGRFKTLEEVIDHYDHGVARAENLDPNLAKHPEAGLGLGAEEKAALIAFLRTLTEAHREPPAR